MQETLSLSQYADKVYSLIQSLTTEHFFENITQNPVYLASSDKGKEALLFIRRYFASLHGHSLMGLYANDLEALEADTEQAYTLLNRPPDGTTEQELIGLASRLSSERSAALAVTLVNQEEVSRVYRNASRRFDEVLTEATQKLDELKQLQKTIEEISLDQLEKQSSIDTSFEEGQDKIKGLFDSIDRLKESNENEYAKFKKSLFETMEAQQRDWVNQVRDTTNAELEAIKKPLREISSFTGAKLNAKEFDAEADSHNMWSFVWLVISAGLLVGLGYMGFRFNAEISTAAPQQVGNAIEATAFRVLLFSLGTFALIFSTRTYSSHRHNFVINRHRRNALATFQTFANGSDDPQVKNAILLQAAQCIFSPQVSGYVRNESDTVTNTPVVNLIENLTKQT